MMERQKILADAFVFEKDPKLAGWEEARGFSLEKARLDFTSLHNQRRGLIASMLKRSYAEFLKCDGEHWHPEISKWEEFDRMVFDHSETVGACVFLSWFGDLLIGFGSYDPRQEPGFGIVGYNCILPGFRGLGFGKRQIREILRRFRIRGIRIAKTSTLSGERHNSAQRMYVACGFRETGRRLWEGNPSQTVVYYEKKVSNDTLDRTV